MQPQGPQPDAPSEVGDEQLDQALLELGRRLSREAGDAWMRNRERLFSLRARSRPSK